MSRNAGLVPVWLIVALAGLSAGGEAPSAPALPGLVSWWPGQGTANDVAGTNHGTLLGGATATIAGKIGQAFAFDGTNGLVQIPDSPQLNPANLTIAAWVLLSALDSAGSGGSPPGQQYIVFKQNSRDSFFEGFQLGKDRTAAGDVFSFIVASAAGQEVILRSATLLTTGTWYHVAGVRGSNFTQLYVNGQLESQAMVDFPQDYGTNALFFGSSGQPFWDHKFAGILDEVSLYSRPLSDAEIANTYTVGSVSQTWGDITFFVGSDLHYGYANGTTPCADTCRATIDRMNALPGQAYPPVAGGGPVDTPRGVLLLGDLTENGAGAEWNTFTNDWGLNGDQRLSYPVYECYGNHDCYWSDQVSGGIKARNPLRRGVTNISPDGYHYSWDWDNVHFVCLNLFPGKGVDSNLGYARNSLSFLVDDLAKTVGSTGRPVILYHHYGFDSFAINGWWTDQERSNYCAVIQPYNVIAILAGHNHLVDWIPWCGFDTFNDGTMNKPLQPPFTNFMVGHVTQTNLTIAQRNVDGTWGAVFTRPIVIDYQPRVVSDPASTSAPVGSTASMAVRALGPNLSYQWFFNGTNRINGATSSTLDLSNLCLAQSGAYSVSITNAYGGTVSQPARLDVAAQLSMRPVLGIRLSGNIGASLGLQYRDSLGRGTWQPLATVVLTNSSQSFFDGTAPPEGRFYRVASPGARVAIEQVPIVTIFGNAGDRLRLDCSDAPDTSTNWRPLTTLTLTESSQLYVDTSAPNLARQYRALAAP